MGVTTLKLVHAVPFWSNPQLVYAIGSNPFAFPYLLNIDNAEVRDLTVDCNMRAQVGHRVAKAAVSISGRHSRIRRVRAIDYGTHIPAIECFVLLVAGPDPRPGFGDRIDSRIEDCILEQPSLSGLYTITCMNLAGGQDPLTQKPAYHRACVIRNNYVNNEYVDNPVAIERIQYESGAWVVTTRTPHGRNNDDWVVVSGAIDSSAEPMTYGFSKYFNGSFKVSGVTPGQPYRFTITPANSPLTSVVPGGDMWIGRWRSHPVSVQKVERVSAGSVIAELTSYTPHNKRPGEWLNLTGVASPSPAGGEAYYGRLPVEFSGSPPEPTSTKIRYRMNSSPSLAAITDTNPPAVGNGYDQLFIGISTNAFSSDGGSEAITEGNRVFNSSVGGSYHDTGGSRDQTDRNNYYSNVARGPDQFLHQNFGLPGVLQPGQLQIAGNTATVSAIRNGLPFEHGIKNDQAVLVQPAVGGKSFFAVTAETQTTFSFAVPIGTTGPSIIQFAAVWQVGLAVRENNVIEMGDASNIKTGYGYSLGMRIDAAIHEDQRVYQSVIVKNNCFFQAGVYPFEQARGVQIAETARAMIEGNLIGTLSAYSLLVTRCEPLYLSENFNPAGIRLNPAKIETAEPFSTVEAKIEEALLFSI